MEFTTVVKRLGMLVLSATLLTACGGGSDGNGSTDSTAPNPPTSSGITTAGDGSITIAGTAEENSTVSATFPDGSQKTTTADSNGNYSLKSAPLQPSGSVTITSTDAGGNTSSPTNLVNIASYDTIKANYLVTGIMPPLGFTPSLGINTEAPQGGADTAGMPMPFVDIFRTARPFKEQQKKKKDAQGNYLSDDKGRPIYIKTDNTFDANGWTTSLDPETKLNSNEPEIRSTATKMLQGALKGSMPEGKYTFLYEGNGTVEFSIRKNDLGSLTNYTKIPNENKYILDISLYDISKSDESNDGIVSSKNQLFVGITNISPNNYIKNIRIIMPGGTCTGNPFIRVDKTDTCPNGTIYQSFEERLQADRNAIIFNPDYLMFLRNFKVIRMMNLMEASLKKLCYSANDCPAGVGTWNHRAKLNDAVWGGNDGRTTDEDHKGVPVEVMIALANTLKRDIWLNMPHIASNDYVTQYAKQVYANLDPDLKVYLEYSNEVWNSGFAGHAYTTSQGNSLGLNTIPIDTQQYCDTLSAEDKLKNTRCQGDYYARLRYYSQRAVEIFKLWNTEFSGSDARLVRVLGSFIGDKILTQRMLEHVPTSDVDVVAIAPYFFGCPYASACIDANQTLLDATTVDDIFDAIDQNPTVDVKSLDGTIAAVENQLTITSAYGLKLVSYEGGQHLVTGVLGSSVTASDQTRLRKLFNDANRDPRMKDRYMTFLNAWKDLSNDGTSLFTLYTMPQSYYRYGNFGIKEHLNKSRAESPKFDGVMSFQESVGNCWWDESGCTP